MRFIFEIHKNEKKITLKFSKVQKKSFSVKIYEKKGKKVMHIHTKTLFTHKIMLHSRVQVILEVLINFEADNNRVALPG